MSLHLKDEPTVGHLREECLLDERTCSLYLITVPSIQYGYQYFNLCLLMSINFENHITPWFLEDVDP